jgi:hypothetical protein
MNTQFFIRMLMSFFGELQARLYAPEVSIDRRPWDE